MFLRIHRSGNQVFNTTVPEIALNNLIRLVGYSAPSICATNMLSASPDANYSMASVFNFFVNVYEYNC